MNGLRSAQESFNTKDNEKLKKDLNNSYEKAAKKADGVSGVEPAKKKYALKKKREKEEETRRKRAEELSDKKRLEGKIKEDESHRKRAEALMYKKRAEKLVEKLNKEKDQEPNELEVDNSKGCMYVSSSGETYYLHKKVWIKKPE